MYGMVFPFLIYRIHGEGYKLTTIFRGNKSWGNQGPKICINEEGVNL